MDHSAFQRRLTLDGRAITFFDIRLLEEKGIAPIGRLPYGIRILVENLLRHLDGRVVTETDLREVVNWRPSYDAPVEIPHHPGRVLMQDFTGVPAVVDLAAMRDAVVRQGGDPGRINPLIPVELVVDHSVQVDWFGTSGALARNVKIEYERNAERYALLKWAQKNFDNFSVVPPNSGICHQVNLEYLGRVIATRPHGDGLLAFPDSLVGTDSHTTMINALGVMGWGVGGIEAEAVMLGQPYVMTIPEVIGVRLSGRLKPGATATDLVLLITETLRKKGVVEKFVEFFGPGLAHLDIPDRATIANMAPEYGATMGFFPIDARTVAYLEATNRADRAALVEACAKEMSLFHDSSTEPEYTDVVDIDLASVVPAVAGPSRPQDRVVLTDLESRFEDLLRCGHERDADLAALSQFLDESGSLTARSPICEPSGRRRFPLNLNGREASLGDGSVVIAAITSCTNTSNPHVLLGAGLLARNAVRRGLKVPSYVKTSLVPGSRVVLNYLTESGLMPYLEALGFHVAGFGCTTCIGNSGPLHPQIDRAIREYDLNVAAVLSGNRNFEARIHQRVKSNFLASPILVVAFALAGRMDVNLLRRPLGLDPNGEAVYLADIWPKSAEIDEMARRCVKPEFYRREYARVFDGDEFWRNLDVGESTTFPWDDASTYIKHPPYFEGFSPVPSRPADIVGARALLVLGDSVTTDHISPAGGIPRDYPAGRYLTAQSVTPEEFNSYGARRGNHEVMTRGTFGNIRIRNRLAGERQGSFTRKFPEGAEMTVFEAAEAYRIQGVPLVVLAGREYGTGSSRDWAAKGTRLLGIRAVIAESYERIHRSNLVGMGVLPLVFAPGQSVASLGLTGEETFSITGIDALSPRRSLAVTAVRPDGGAISFTVTARLDTDIDVAYFEHGGILPYVLRKLMNV